MQINPKGKEKGISRVERGACCARNANMCRVAQRSSSNFPFLLGFRIVLGVSDASQS